MWRITFYPVNDQTDEHSRVKTTEKFSFALEALDGVSWNLFGIPLKKGDSHHWGFSPFSNSNPAQKVAILYQTEGDLRGESYVCWALMSAVKIYDRPLT